MPDGKYIDDPHLIVLNGTEKFPISDGINDFYSTPADVKTFVLANYPGASSIVSTGVVTSGIWNSKFKPRVVKLTTTTGPSPNADTTDVYVLTALGSTANFATPSGTPEDRQKLIIQVTDNGTARLLNFSSGYLFLAEIPNPGTTTVSQLIHFEFLYNNATSKWVCVLCTADSNIVTSVNGFTGAVVLTYSDVNAAPLASPGLTGVPTAPTATVGTNTTQIATTAFVLANAGTPSLTSTYVGYGDGSNLITGNANMTFNGTDLLAIDSTLFIGRLTGTDFGIQSVSSTTAIYSGNSSSILKLVNDGTILATGYLGIGVSPTARLQVAAGTTVAGTSPIKLTRASAALNTTPEDGAIEIDASHIYHVIGSTRHQLDQQGALLLAATNTWTASNVFSAGLSVSTSNMSIVDVNVVLSVSTGTKFGTSTSQKFAFWNATPMVQPTTAFASATYVSNVGTPLTSADTFEGYTVAQLFKILKTRGDIA